MRRLVIAVAIIVVALLVGGSVTSTSTDLAPNRRIAAVFVGDTDRHTCTAESIHSTTGDLMLTAAHCVSAITAPLHVVPGYAAGREPFGAWSVTAVYLDPAWISGQDDNHDFAILRVAPPPGKHRRSLEATTGRGYSLAPFRAGVGVRVIGYGAGSGDSPVGCRGSTRIARGAPTITCRGLVDGTSGSPWLVKRSVIGIVGGFHQGGCVSFISHSPILTDGLPALIARAERKGPGDTPPSTVPNDC
ncbi:trypsin-like serine peptidase [Williamsia sp. MIQD14]|uniref:trypsin-like serine peptidase n=1 Tax=Williamsia sp. MIQD14 TaxID=3425703 RepID=UPI003DA1AB2E